MANSADRRTVRTGVLVGVAVAGTLLAGVMGWRATTAWLRVDATRTAALEQYGGTETEAFLAALTDPATPLADQNRLIYLLGQRGDPSALPVLEALRTGEPCDHSRFVCQRELDKAIGKIHDAGR